MSKKQLVAKDIRSMREFADVCAPLSNQEIYELFEDGITQKLRDEIYATFWSLSNEPARAALRQLGERYCVQSLYTY